MEAGAVPAAPDRALLSEFYARFTEPGQIKDVVESSESAVLVQMDNVLSLRLRDAASGRIKVGRGIIHVQDFFLRYSYAILAKVGIRQWAPDLEAAIDSLWNEACRISAIKIFRVWVTGKAFPNASYQYVNDILLLEKAYNHYVHYWLAKKYKRESKESGSNQKDDSKRATQRARQRVSPPLKAFHSILILHADKTIPVAS